MNADICFVPASHTVPEKLPAVSGSSGRLIVEHRPADEAAPCWPGQVFSRTDLDYADAMRQYAEATRDRLQHTRAGRTLTDEQPTHWRKAWEGRAARYQVRSQRKREDIAWKTAKAEQRQARLAYQALPKAERPQYRAAWLAANQTWRQVCEQRQHTLQARQQENEAWHQRNRQLEGSPGMAEDARQWLAILAITDNCTRQCLGLPLFLSGSKLTSDELVAALRSLLPSELEFLISDQGTVFRTQAFAQLAFEKDFTHVPIYRHRPESNGIAERFVRTLKEWLKSQSWQSANDLRPLLAKFQPEYNDRPHQGLAIPGLSPDEFAKRIWVT
ncbi:MAG: integrase core domain-containing protein [Chloroflexota bacterium]